MAVGALVVAAVLAGATALGLVWRRRDGQLRDQRMRQARLPGNGFPGGKDRHRPDRRLRRLTEDQLGQVLGTRATLLQFSSSFCSPCRAARRVLADLAAHTAGVVHIEIDVADRVDLVRLLDIRRTPTVLLLGPDGDVARRATGVPSRADLTAAVSLAGTAEREQPMRSWRMGSDSGHGRA
jgi:thiol-disulfide isomerase/thioredoxin